MHFRGGSPDPKAKPAIAWPELDEWCTPVDKLPDCPACGEDELGVIHKHYIKCYACGWDQWDERDK